jgi:hypothetical protein
MTLELPDWAIEIVKESPTVLVCLLVMYGAYYALSAAHQSHIESKEKEIERLVKEKNDLQRLVLSNRLSTEEKKK